VIPTKKRAAASEPELQPATASPPAGLGFLLANSSGTVLSANAKAVRILSYTETLVAQFQRTLKGVIETLLAPDAPPGHGWSTLLVSGRRRYRCWGIPVDLEKERQVAILIERVASKERALAGVRDEHHLTSREEEMVVFLADGFTNKEIAARMGISVNTVKVFIRSVMLKLGVTTRAGIVGSLFEVPTSRSASDQSAKRSNPFG
jgi:DNA-binding CsgD family transcriptional regulator